MAKTDEPTSGHYGMLQLWMGILIQLAASKPPGKGLPSRPASVARYADQLERLHDAVLLDVLNRISDVKALGRCALVSRRFHALVPLVDSVLAHIARVLLGGIARPIHTFGQILSPAEAAESRRSDTPPPQPASSPTAGTGADVSHHSPSEVLRSFREMRRLHIELPTGELGIDDGVLLKWKADFAVVRYFKNRLDGQGLLRSDAMLVQTATMRTKVAEFTQSQDGFFVTWAESYAGLTSLGEKIGADGDIRLSCCEGSQAHQGFNLVIPPSLQWGMSRANQSALQPKSSINSISISQPIQSAILDSKTPTMVSDVWRPFLDFGVFNMCQNI